MTTKRICVFCGSSVGADPVFAAAAKSVGEALARRGLELVYGGGNVGLMGIVADAALKAGGRVTGVIPQSLVDRELAHRGIADLRIVSSMHERKALMADLSDAFIALPGGYGTLEEFSPGRSLAFTENPLACSTSSSSTLRSSHRSITPFA